MRIQLVALLALAGLSACAAPSATPARAATNASPAREVSASPEPAAIAGQTLAEADLAYISQLGASRGGRFDTERQIFALRRAVELYTQFLERAAGHPELGNAVKKSRERRADALDTIVFLEQSLREDARRP